MHHIEITVSLLLYNNYIKDIKRIVIGINDEYAVKFTTDYKHENIRKN